MPKGLIIYFDGPDGVGKTTQLKMTADKLRADSYQVHVLHALGGSPIGDKLAQVMGGTDARPSETDMHMALAAQYAALDDIRKRRDNGEIVLVDRSPLSIIAFQVYGGGLNPEMGYAEAKKLIAKVNPDGIFVLHASSATRLNRRKARNEIEGADYFETKPADYHDKTAEGYMDASKVFAATLVDAEPRPADINETIMQEINNLLHVR